jgi:hypothetical protein
MVYARSGIRVAVLHALAAVGVVGSIATVSLQSAAHSRIVASQVTPNSCDARPNENAGQMTTLPMVLVEAWVLELQAFAPAVRVPKDWDEQAAPLSIGAICTTITKGRATRGLGLTGDTAIDVVAPSGKRHRLALFDSRAFLIRLPGSSTRAPEGSVQEVRIWVQPVVSVIYVEDPQASALSGLWSVSTVNGKRPSVPTFVQSRQLTLTSVGNLRADSFLLHDACSDDRTTFSVVNGEIVFSSLGNDSCRSDAKRLRLILLSRPRVSRQANKVVLRSKGERIVLVPVTEPFLGRWILTSVQWPDRSTTPGSTTNTIVFTPGRMLYSGACESFFETEVLAVERVAVFGTTEVAGRECSPERVAQTDLLQQVFDGSGYFTEALDFSGSQAGVNRLLTYVRSDSSKAVFRYLSST